MIKEKITYEKMFKIGCLTIVKTFNGKGIGFQIGEKVKTIWNNKKLSDFERMSAIFILGGFWESKK